MKLQLFRVFKLAAKAFKKPTNKFISLKIATKAIIVYFGKDKKEPS